MNDYTAMLLHDAHYGDLLKEARGGWLISASRPVDEARRLKLARRRRVSRLLWVVMLALVAVLRTAGA